MTQANATTDIDALKTRLKATWMDGNYDYFSRFMESSAVELLDRLDIPAGASLLDVACGSGQLGLIAARRGIKVTGVDIATNAILAARSRANAEGLDARFDEGDAEALPYADASFDVVASLFGAMFAPRPERVAAELLRVCRPGGTIAMANWTAGGFIGTMFKTFARFIAPPGMPAPVLWGDERTVTERFGSGVSQSAIDPRHLSVRLSVRAGRRGGVFSRKLRTDDACVRRARRGRTSSASRGACPSLDVAQHRERPQSHDRRF